LEEFESTKQKGSAVGYHAAVVVNFSRDGWHNFSDDGIAAVWTKAEGSVEEEALYYYDTEAFQDEEALLVADLQSQSNHTVFNLEGSPRAATYLWVEFEAARALND